MGVIQTKHISDTWEPILQVNPWDMGAQTPPQELLCLTRFAPIPAASTWLVNLARKRPWKLTAEGQKWRFGSKDFPF